MICPNCGAENPDDSLFCNKCGTKILLENANSDTETDNTSVNTNISDKIHVRKKRNFIFPIVGIVLFILYGIAVYFINNNGYHFVGNYGYLIPSIIIIIIIFPLIVMTFKNIIKLIIMTFKNIKKGDKKSIIITIIVLLIICVIGVVVYKNTPKQKAIRVSNTVINSLKTHDGKDLFLTDIALKNKMGVDSPFTGLSIFDYKFKSISKSNVNETYTIYKINESDSDWQSEIKREESIYLSNDSDGRWSEDKNDTDLIDGSSNNSVTFTSAKYKVKRYYITYDMNYSEIDGDKKEKDVTVTVQEQTHDKNDFEVIDIIGID